MSSNDQKLNFEIKKAHELYPIIEKYDELLDSNDIDGINNYFKTINHDNHIMEMSALLRISSPLRYKAKEWFKLYERAYEKERLENLQEHNFLRGLLPLVTSKNLYPIIDYFYKKFAKREYEEVDLILSQVSMDLRFEYLISIIRFTYAAKHHLPYWETLRDNILDEFNERGIEGKYYLRGLF